MLSYHQDGFKLNYANKTSKMFSNWILLAKNTKDSINEAIAGFHDLENVNPDGSLTGICAGLANGSQYKNY